MNITSKVEDQENKGKIAHYDIMSRNFVASQKESRYCDVKLKVAGRVFECHRLILDSNSKYFQALFRNGFREAEAEIIPLTSEYVDGNSFSKLFYAMYGEPLEIENDIIPLYITSLYLELTHFIEQCKLYILDHLEVIDIQELIMLPQIKFDRVFSRDLKKYVCQHFPKIYTRLLGISFEIFEDLLSDPDLCVFEKKHLVDFGKKWISHDLQNRKQHLQSVASLLMPYRTLPERLIKLVEAMESNIQNDYDVKLSLNTLLGVTDIALHDDDDEPLYEPLQLPNPLFFIQPNDGSEIFLGTYKNNAWKFLNEFELPIVKDPMISYEGAVADRVIYFLAEYKQPRTEKWSLLCHSFQEEMQEWIQLLSPPNMPMCLVTSSDSTLYLYDHLVDKYQISYFEPSLNRWLKVPAVNYPRTFSGIASNEQILYMVGGIPLKTIASESPKNIIEMYDSRCGNWSRITVSDAEVIGNIDYNKKVCFLNNFLFLMNEERGLAALDVRNNQWVYNFDAIHDDVEKVPAYLTAVNEKLWVIYQDSTNGILVFNDSCERAGSIPNDNVSVLPISKN